MQYTLERGKIFICSFSPKVFSNLPSFLWNLKGGDDCHGTALRMHFIFLVNNSAENPVTQSWSYSWYIRNPWELPLKGFITFVSLAVSVAHRSDNKHCLDLMLQSISLNITGIKESDHYDFQSLIQTTERQVHCLLDVTINIPPGRAYRFTEAFSRVCLFACFPEPTY